MPSGSNAKRERQYEHIKDSAEGPTRDQLYSEARRRDIKGRSTMTKAQLSKALGR
ncbi:hypothetical protein ACFXKG_19665 [Streptomyces sp. NPDC059255]|uniref:hypothetical protein n=1 Tax=Streptomyces sp. NPDC059255 TaxID=3346793 RepID=UPI003682FE0D